MRAPFRGRAQRDLSWVRSKIEAFVVAASAMLALTGAAQADCQKQIQLFGEDVKNIALTQTQKQDIGGILDDARRHCWAHLEQAALDYVARARRTAGIGPLREEFDWENVPLESLEPKDP